MSATTPVQFGTRPPYRPALDGLRAIAVTGVLVFHLNPNWLPGGWFGVDLFFVLSGFLITTLLVREQNRTGRINFPAFWLARMRRLLPALVTTLFAVLIAAWFLTIDARRQAVSYDILSALGYVANWRFILGDEGYFATLNLPSPVRHTWSLSIEEQFYIAFPLIMALLGWITTKRLIHTMTLTVLAVLSACWMAYLYVPGSDPVRVYFGTDTRAFELLIGAVGAIALRKVAFDGFAKRTRLVQVLGFLGIALVVFSMFALPDDDPIPYQGGLVLLCLGSFAAILAAASSPNALFSKIVGVTPLRWIGLISYPLYLWHWPVIVFLNTPFTGLRGVPLAIVQATISVLLAWATYKFIEGPIRGRLPLISRAPRLGKTLVRIAIPLLIIATVSFGKSTMPFTEAEPTPGHAEIEAMDVTASKPRVAMLFGNSIPNSLAKTVQRDAHPYLSLVSNTFIGCEAIDGNKYTGGKEVLPDEDCLRWRSRWPTVVSEHKPDIFVYFVSQTLLSDRLVEGKVLKFGTPQHDEHLLNGLTTMRQKALAAGAGHFALSNLACHDLPTFDVEEIERINDVNKVEHLNTIVQQWAEQNDVPVVDTFEALCPGGQYSDTVNDIELYGDGLHFTPESGPIFWDWMAPQLIAYLEQVD